MILLNGAASAVADKHVPMYLQKGMIQRMETLAEVPQFVNVPESPTLNRTPRWPSSST